MLFEQMLELSHGERPSFLEKVSRTDAALAEELRSLLEAYESHPSFLEDGIDAVVASLLAEDGPPTGRVGPYEVVRELGRGGMGVVCLARRIDGGFEQYVAVKLARWGLTEEHLERLAAEREILARLKHPGIAPLYGGGVTEGRPYLVMEYVEGESITEYCKRRGASLEQRLDLLMEVCDAVQYAHQNLVVHRDLKPSNILVNAEGQVKLLDFGIAKLLQPEPALGVPLEADNTHTSGALTPGYSAPEQLRRGPITTATDVFSLGVLAYELLSGSRPFKVRGLSPAQVELVICETEPRAPSVAAAEHGRRLDSDLDNVILKALRKEPRERYESTRALADDFKRYLRGLPVVARTPTRRYRVGKFVRRNTVAVGSTVAVMAALLGGVGLTTWQARVASARAAEASRERDNAEAAATRTQTINTFLQGVLSTANPSWYVDSDAKGPEITVLQALEEAARRMDEELSDDPEVRADIHHTLGDTYRALLNHEGMVRHFEASLALRREAFVPPHPEIAEGLFYLGSARAREGAWALGDSLLGEAIAMQRERDEGNNLPFMLQSIGGNLRTLGRMDEAIDALREAATLFEDRYPPGHAYYPAWGATRVMTSEAYGERGDLEEARIWANAPGTVLDDSVVWSESVLRVTGVLRALEGDWPQAESLLRRAVAMSVAPGSSLFELAMQVYAPQQRWEEGRIALRTADQWFAQEAEQRPVSVQQRLKPRAAIAYLNGLEGRAPQALAQAQEVLDEIDRLVAPEDTVYFWSTRRLARAALGRALLVSGQTSEARELFLMNHDAVLSRGIEGRAWYEANADLVALFEATGDNEARDRYAAVMRELGFYGTEPGI